MNWKKKIQNKKKQQNQNKKGKLCLHVQSVDTEHCYSVTFMETYMRAYLQLS